MAIYYDSSSLVSRATVPAVILLHIPGNKDGGHSRVGVASRASAVPAMNPHRQLISGPNNIAPAFTREMSQQPSEACCNTPAILGKNYKEKGIYITIDGLKTYKTGPSSSKHGILVVYDVFGFFPQTLQGADLLATADEKHQHQVFMPDFFEGQPADITWYPPDTEEKGKLLGSFFQTAAAPPKTVEKAKRVIQELKSKYPEIVSWGIVGYCWGGKIVNLLSQKSTSFTAAAVAHPAMIDSDDAQNVTIPLLMIPSGDESQPEVDDYVANLKVRHQVEWFRDQIHGFMAARSNLEDEKVKAAYKKAYLILLAFFEKHLGV